MNVTKVERTHRSFVCPVEWAHGQQVYPGDPSVVVTLFPNESDVARDAGHPVRLRVCSQCGDLNVHEYREILDGEEERLRFPRLPSTSDLLAWAQARRDGAA